MRETLGSGLVDRIGTGMLCCQHLAAAVGRVVVPGGRTPWDFFCVSETIVAEETAAVTPLPHPDMVFPNHIEKSVSTRGDLPVVKIEHQTRAKVNGVQEDTLDCL